MTMNRMKKYFILVLGLLLCLTALWGCGKDETPQESGEEAPQTDAGQPEADPVVTLSDTLECSDGERVLRFIRNEDGSWSWRDDAEFPLDNTYVTELLTTVSAMLEMTPISTEEGLEDLGLDREDKYLTASNEAGETSLWYLGKKHESGRYYALIAGDETETVYLAPAELTDQLSRSIYDMMLLPELPAIPAESVRGITLHFSGETHELRQDSAGNWLAGQTNVTYKVGLLLDQLAQLRLAACLDFKPSSGALPLCGLDPYAIRVEITYVNTVEAEQTFVLTVGSARGEHHCVTVNEDSTVYLMESAAVKPLLSLMQ